MSQMTVGRLQHNLELLDDDGAPVRFITCGPRGEVLLLRVVECDMNDDGGLSIELELLRVKEPKDRQCDCGRDQNLSGTDHHPGCAVFG